MSAAPLIALFGVPIVIFIVALIAGSLVDLPEDLPRDLPATPESAPGIPAFQLAGNVHIPASLQATWRKYLAIARTVCDRYSVLGGRRISDLEIEYGASLWTPVQFIEKMKGLKASMFSSGDEPVLTRAQIVHFLDDHGMLDVTASALQKSSLRTLEGFARALYMREATSRQMDSFYVDFLGTRGAASSLPSSAALQEMADQRSLSELELLISEERQRMGLSPIMYRVCREAPPIKPATESELISRDPLRLTRHELDAYQHPDWQSTKS